MNKKGFTLVEVLVGLLVLITIVGSFGLVMKTAKRAIRQANAVSQNTLELQSQMERLRDRKYSELLALNNTTFNGRGTILTNQLSPDLISIKLTLKDSTATLVTLRGNR